MRRTFSWQRGQRQAKPSAAATMSAASRGIGLERAAPTLMLHLAPEARAILAQTCTALRAVAATVASRQAPPPHPTHAAHTHEGGAGGVDKENQDTFFVATPSADLAVYAVLDGHGRRYGRLASRVAAARMRLVLCGLHRWAVDHPEAALQLAFAEAHDAIRAAIRQADPTVRTVRGRDGAGDGAYLLHWIEDEVRIHSRAPPLEQPRHALAMLSPRPATAPAPAPAPYPARTWRPPLPAVPCDLHPLAAMNVCHPQDEPDGRWDAVDGGTTATVVALVRGETAYIAMVGDSSVLLLGRDPKTDSPTHRVLLDEHSPTSLAEYERILKLPSAAAGVRFVYECPDFEEFPIFGTDGAGAPALSDEGLASADAHGCLRKNSRDDRFSLLAIPEANVSLPKLPKVAGKLGAACTATVDEQAITMTRSLGDFYAHHHGVTAVPEVRALPLARLFPGPAAAADSPPAGGAAAAAGARTSQCALPHLYLASDGVWDLWEYDEVSEQLVPAVAAKGGAKGGAAKGGAAKAGDAKGGDAKGGDAGAAVEARAAALIEATRARGANFYDEAADNLTGVLVELRPPPVPPPVATPARLPSPAKQSPQPLPTTLASPPKEVPPPEPSQPDASAVPTAEPPAIAEALNYWAKTGPGPLEVRPPPVDARAPPPPVVTSARVRTNAAAAIASLSAQQAAEAEAQAKASDGAAAAAASGSQPLDVSDAILPPSSVPSTLVKPDEGLASPLASPPPVRLNFARSLKVTTADTSSAALAPPSAQSPPIVSTGGLASGGKAGATPLATPSPSATSSPRFRPFAGQALPGMVPGAVAGAAAAGPSVALKPALSAPRSGGKSSFPASSATPPPTVAKESLPTLLGGSGGVAAFARRLESQGGLGPRPG
jgi:serine/threonine protein phosphatase PrpC